MRTHDGALMGTPAYMAPEQSHEAARVDGKADVYSLGVMLYQMVCGKMPFQGGLQLILIKHATEEPPPLLAQVPELDPELCALVHRMMAKRPANRPTMHEIAAELERQGAPKASSRLPSISADEQQGVGTLPLLPESSLSGSAGQASITPKQRRLRAAIAVTAIVSSLCTTGWILVRQQGPADAPGQRSLAGPDLTPNAAARAVADQTPDLGAVTTAAQRGPAPAPVVREEPQGAAPREQERRHHHGRSGEEDFPLPHVLRSRVKDQPHK